jgi:hypothetical protein
MTNLRDYEVVEEKNYGCPKLQFPRFFGPEIEEKKKIGRQHHPKG